MEDAESAARKEDGLANAKPPRQRVADGGYAWVVVGACSVSLFASVGFSIGGIGVATVSFGRHFPNSTTEELGWIGGLRNFQFMASPLAVVLIKLIGCRWTSIGGSLLSAAAIATSAFAGELWHAYILYSIVAGVGIALTYTSTFNILGQYFDRKRNLAFSLVALGNALGIVVFPYLLQFVVDRLGHVQALYVTAALKVIEVASGSLFAPPPAPELRQDAIELAAVAAAATSSSALESHANGGFEKDVDVARADESALARPAAVAASETARAVPTTPARHELAPSNTDADAGPAAAAAARSSEALGMLLLLRHGWTWLLLLHAFGFGASLVAAEALMPLYVIRKGVDADDAALGITMIGAGFLAAAAVLLVVGTRQFDRFVVYVIATSLIGVSTAALTSSTLIAVYLSLCGLFGVGMGSALSLFMSVLVSLGGALGDVAHVFGLYTFAKGVGSICGPVLVGLIQTQTDDDIGWYVSSGVALLAAVALVPLIVLSRRPVTAHYNGGGRGGGESDGGGGEGGRSGDNSGIAEKDAEAMGMAERRK